MDVLAPKGLVILITVFIQLAVFKQMQDIFKLEYT